MSLEFLKDLNDNQKIAVLDDSNACLLNAIVGSGKTRVLVTKVIYLNKYLSVPFDDMVVFTFSNKAANEIKERIKEHIPEIVADSIPYMGTFHSVAFKMLKTILPMEEIGHTKEFSILTPEEESELAESIINSEKLNIKYINKLSKRIALAYKGKFLYGTMRYNDDIEKLCQLLESEKKSQNKLTFDNLINYAQKLITKVNYRPKWVIIDEFQDTNPEQYAFVKSMIDSDTKIFAVGDPNQSIYSFNGGTSKIFDKYIKDFNPNILHLPLNYRSCSNILELARAFSTTDSSELKANRETGNKIIVKRQYDQFTEANYISNKIKKLIESGLHYKDIAVFYRIQNLSTVFEDVFTKAQIPFEVSVRKTISDIPALKWLLKVLKASVNESDKFNTIGMLSDPIFGDNLTQSKAKEIVKNYSPNSFNESPELLKKVKSFKTWCDNGGNIDELFDYYNLKLNLIPSSIDYLDNVENVKLFFKRLHEYVSSNNGLSVFDGISEFVNSAALHGLDILHNGISLDNDSVKLMTLHASKGLEFKQVFIIGINDGLIPIFARTPEEEAEEQRLFFVGITRAKDNLELYYYSNPPERRFKSGKSKYLYWLPEELIIENSYEPNEFNSSAFKRELKNLKTAENEKATTAKTIEIINNVKYRHPKYGIGKVITQTDANVIIKFDDFGIKRFSKAFCEQLLEKIAEPPSESPKLPQLQETDSNMKWFKHKKYGKGCLVAETEKDLTIKFEGYGEKKILKLLSKGLLEEI